MARVVIADESFKYVSQQDQVFLVEFIKQLSEQMGLQIILVTHSKTISEAADKRFVVEKVNGVSKVTND